MHKATTIILTTLTMLGCVKSNESLEVDALRLQVEALRELRNSTKAIDQRNAALETREAELSKKQVAIDLNLREIEGRTDALDQREAALHANASKLLEKEKQLEELQLANSKALEEIKAKTQRLEELAKLSATRVPFVEEIALDVSDSLYKHATPAEVPTYPQGRNATEASKLIDDYFERKRKFLYGEFKNDLMESAILYIESDHDFEQVAMARAARYISAYLADEAKRKLVNDAFQKLREQRVVNDVSN